MKALLLIPLLFVLGCTQPTQMSQAETDAVKACLEKGWVPNFYATNSRRDFKCSRPNQE